MTSRRHRRDQLVLPERDHNTIASGTLLRNKSTVYDAWRRSTLDSLVRSLDDRRAFHPDDFFRPAASVFGDDARVVERASAAPSRSPKVKFSRPAALGFHFNVPERVAVCVRRKSRREVLFAKRRQGRGARSPKKFNYWSTVRC